MNIYIWMFAFAMYLGGGAFRCLIASDTLNGRAGDVSDDVLSKAAAAGNADAAWSLYGRFAFVYGDDKGADRWLERSAELKNPAALLTLARLVKNEKHPYAKFGSSKAGAVKSLLMEASLIDGEACYELGVCYETAYFGVADLVAARSIFERGAKFLYRPCWTKLAHYYWEGIGGQRIPDQAYYWISVESRCLGPNSISGAEVREFRNQIAKHLDKQSLVKQWSLIDSLVNEMAKGSLSPKPPPFLSGLIDSDAEIKARGDEQKFEDAHRKKWIGQ